MKIYKAHILFTKEPNRFEILENGYIAVDDDGHILAISSTPDEWLSSLDNEVTIPTLSKDVQSSVNGVYTPLPAGFLSPANGGTEGGVKTIEGKGGGSAFIDFGDRLLIPAMNDLHVHASQYRNQGIAMDLELLPWLQNYTFPEEMKYADSQYAERMYRRFVHDLWRFGTMRSCVFATSHTAATRLLMQLFQEAGMGALVGKVAMNRNCPTALCEDPPPTSKAKNN